MRIPAVFFIGNNSYGDPCSTTSGAKTAKNPEKTTDFGTKQWQDDLISTIKWLFTSSRLPMSRNAGRVHFSTIEVLAWQIGRLRRIAVDSALYP